MTNNTPTTPDDAGNWYREGGEIVRVDMNMDTNLFSGIIYYRHGSQHALNVAPDGLWRGRVPQAGTWAPRELFDDEETVMERENIIPTTPGPWWISFCGEPPRIVEVTPDCIAYLTPGDEYPSIVYTSDVDGVEWLGPVPEYGEWVPRGKVDELLRVVDRMIEAAPK